MTETDYAEPTLKRAKYEFEEKDDAMSEERLKKFMGVLKETVQMPNTTPSVKKEHAPKELESYESLEKTLGSLEIRHEWSTVKVTPGRITHCL